MASNGDPIVHQIQQDFQALLAYVTGPEAQTQTAYTVELTLFRRLLALGAALLRLFFLTRAAVRPATPVRDSNGIPLPYHDQRPITYYSVFGKLTFARPYFYAAGVAGICPLDADLSLPARCYSDLLRDWLGYASTDGTYRETTATIKRILDLDLSVQAVEASVQDDACDIAAFYDQDIAARTPTPLGTMLVAQADGKGVPMVQPPGATPIRLGKGQKRTKKKEAIVTALYTIAPYQRSPQEVVATLLHDPHPAEATQRPHPIAKEVRATLDGKAVAITKLAQRAAMRDGPHIQARVALTDGAEALQEQMRTHLPGYTLVLDIIHATEYLWDTANALLGETHPARMAWVRQHLEQILMGQTSAVIAALEAEMAAPNRTTTQVQALRTTIGYYQRNLLYMRYDVYLAWGWPIGTGVVEGACGHLVKDRMEQAGMRWTQSGAQAILDLRAVRLTGDWDAYWQFHRQQQHERRYGASAPVPVRAEAQVLQLAA
jgi:hypothetical protein